MSQKLKFQVASTSKVTLEPNLEWQADAERSVAAAKELGALEDLKLTCLQDQHDAVIRVLILVQVPSTLIDQKDWPVAKLPFEIRMPLAELKERAAAQFDGEYIHAAAVMRE